MVTVGVQEKTGLACVVSMARDEVCATVWIRGGVSEGRDEKKGRDRPTDGVGD